MAKKKAFALRLDPDILEAVEKWAADEFRSVNGQIEWILHNALVKNDRMKKRGRTSAPPPEPSGEDTA